MSQTSSSHGRYAVIGNPIAHSRSPRIHTLFGEQTGIALSYDRILAAENEFVPTVTTFFQNGGRGLNVTVPFKLQAWEWARGQLSERAQLAGAVNTLWMADGKPQGCNTDGVGLIQDLQRLGAPLGGARVLLVGAGGASRGVLQPLVDAGCAQLRIVNRTVARASEMIATWQSQTQHPGKTQLESGGLDDIPGQWDLVINASSSGLGGPPLQMPAGIYAPQAYAYDMMYGAKPTAFLQQAKTQGVAHTADGLGMLVAQAAESFRLWHGVAPDWTPVLATVRAEVAAPA